MPRPITPPSKAESTRGSKQREAIIEYTRVGSSIRVNAVDVETGTEVVFQAPLGASTAAMQRTALSKLKYVMNKQS